MTPAERAREIVERVLDEWSRAWPKQNKAIAPFEAWQALVVPLREAIAAALAAQAAHWEEVGRTQVEAAKWLDCHPARIDLYAKRLREKYDAQAAQTRALREALEAMVASYENRLDDEVAIALARAALENKSLSIDPHASCKENAVLREALSGAIRLLEGYHERSPMMKTLDKTWPQVAAWRAALTGAQEE